LYSERDFIYITDENVAVMFSAQSGFWSTVNRKKQVVIRYLETWFFNNTFAIFPVGWDLVKRNQQHILDWRFEFLDGSKHLKSKISN